jgi:mRNA interferase MazF
VVTVVPVTSSVERVYPFQLLLPSAATGLALDSKAQAEQIRSIDVGRVGERIGVLSPSLMTALDEALRLHLAL